MKFIEFKEWQLVDQPSLRHQFEKWLELQNDEPEVWKSCDIQAAGIELLLRNHSNDIHQSCLTIATVRFNEELQNKGIFKSLLNYLVQNSPWEIIAIEDVNNPILLNFCKKNGFKKISPMYSTSLCINKRNLKRFPVAEFSF
ncbi:N-acetyltransferase [Enterovibrio norvegicus]|uniref:N-acetyltransferase n=1 Tax=Enterovibrio norvegicus TaxID=188144 RepID=UPI0013D2CAE8|nr:N-acetyltransferase [Enterovibrio norvegicus]